MALESSRARRVPGMGGGSLVSVNVGSVAEISTPKRVVRTAIRKSPVAPAARVRVEGVNLAGDDQADRSVHGGPDKAVYAYGSSDLEWWNAALGRDDLGPGAFGENLTVAGLDVSGALVGERWRVGSVELEAAGPRVPCFKLNLRMGDPAFGRRFVAAQRPGTYFRIHVEGELGAGDAVEVVHRPAHGVTVREYFDAIVLGDPVLRRRVAGVPDVAPEWRAWLLGLPEDPLAG